MKKNFVLPKEKFNKLIKQERKLEPVRCNCGSSASVKIHYAFYGPVGVRVECNRCKRVGDLQNITEFISTEGSLGTPVTERSLIRGIKSATKAWSIALAEERRDKYLNG